MFHYLWLPAFIPNASLNQRKEDADRAGQEEGGAKTSARMSGGSCENT